MFFAEIRSPYKGGLLKEVELDRGSQKAYFNETRFRPIEFPVETKIRLGFQDGWVEEYLGTLSKPFPVQPDFREALTNMKYDDNGNSFFELEGNVFRIAAAYYDCELPMQYGTREHGEIENF